MNKNELPENEKNGFKTQAAAAKAARDKKEWWGHNLVILGVDERGGRFFPMYNVWN